MKTKMIITESSITRQKDLIRYSKKLKSQDSSNQVASKLLIELSNLFKNLTWLDWLSKTNKNCKVLLNKKAKIKIELLRPLGTFQISEMMITTTFDINHPFYFKPFYL